ncbi:F0F1 ATP synthase subunit A [Horticoccus luteus]|uniref:ATP synthase subunit a n=1 Tax=Horticoccus luteus TaxID=2862869 RepID=A0A8F9XH73_9BACT|nr:F0F1 ATP synthase subunit A [Horticoccus luteus]QYM79015.1 F0F1 ATP synthase subunit A [Horticoccus luteus]
MSRITKTLLTLGFACTALPAFAAEGHGLSSSADKLFSVGPLPVTNSMVTSWVVAAVLIIVIRLAIRKPKLVPTHSQAIVENLVQGIFDLTAPIVGSKVAKQTFPLLIALFTFILIQNWSGLIPGVGTIFMADHATGGWHEFVRPANADLNGTFALAIVAMACWFYFILRYAGAAFVLRDIFGNKADKHETPGFIYYPLFLIFFGVGLIEVVSIIFRPISLSFRLFGNVFGGENLLHSMSAITPWVLPVPFYFLELLIGLVQALVFTLLVSVYIGLICNHSDGHEEAH